MPSRDNTASNIPAITDQILEELERKGHGVMDTSIANDKDKIISDLVTHVKKQQKVIVNLNEKLHPQNQWDIQQVGGSSTLAKKDTVHKRIESKSKYNIIRRLGDYILGKERNVNIKIDDDSLVKRVVQRSDGSFEPAEIKHTSTFSLEQRKEIEEKIKAELLLQIKDDLRKELIDEFSQKYPQHFRDQKSIKLSKTHSDTKKLSSEKSTDITSISKKTENHKATHPQYEQDRILNVKISDSTTTGRTGLTKNKRISSAPDSSSTRTILPLEDKKSTIPDNEDSAKKQVNPVQSRKKTEARSVASGLEASGNAPQVDVRAKSTRTRNRKDAPVVWPISGAVFDEEEDDDEYDIDTTLDNETLYSLTDKLNGDRKQGVIDHNAPLLIEVTRFHRGEIRNLEHVNLGDSYSVHVGTRKIKIASNRKNNQCQIFYMRRYFAAGIGEYSSNTSENESVKALQVNSPKKSLRYTLPPDKVIFLKAGNDEYRLRVVPARVACKVPDIPQEQGKNFKHFLQYSAVFHIAIIILGSLIYTLTHHKTEKIEEPRFAQVELQPLVIPTPPPKPPAEVKKIPKVKKMDTVKKIKVTKKPTSAKPKPKNAGGGSKNGGNIKKRDVKSSGLLAALGTRSDKQEGKKQALAEISSIDAVSSLDQSSAVLKVSGLSAKVQGARIEVASGELINTSGSNKVLRSGGVAGEGNVGALETGITGNRDIRGRVSATLTRTVKIKGGLSRDEVKGVIDAHMDEVVYCYEKTLMSNPGLAGKAVFEWKVLSSGRVGEVNIKTSSLRSNDIHSCIKAAVKSWQFPKPSGGSVFVSFPFIFDSVSF